MVVGAIMSLMSISIFMTTTGDGTILGYGIIGVMAATMDGAGTILGDGTDGEDIMDTDTGMDTAGEDITTLGIPHIMVMDTDMGITATDTITDIITAIDTDTVEIMLITAAEEGIITPTLLPTIVLLGHCEGVPM